MIIARAGGLAHYASAGSWLFREKRAALLKLAAPAPNLFLGFPKFQQTGD